MANSKTGIAGLDKLLGGGIPGGKGVLLVAPPGTGKSLLCKRFAAENLLTGKKVLYLSTGYSFKAFEKELREANAAINPQKLFFIDCYSWTEPGEKPPQPPNVVLLKSISDVNEVAQAIATGVKAMGQVDSVVLDSVTDLVLYADKESVFKFLQMFHGMITKNEATAMVALEYGLHPNDVNNTINYIFDGVIEMAVNGNRKLRIVRMTGTTHPLEWKEYEISSGLKITIKGE